MNELPPRDEKIGTGSVVDLLVAPYWALAALLGIAHGEPRFSNRRDALLVVGFWTTIAVVAGLVWWVAAGAT